MFTFKVQSLERFKPRLFIGSSIFVQENQRICLIYKGYKNIPN